MSKAPFYSPHLARFRDSTDSHKENEYLQNVFYDLVELFNIANAQEREMEMVKQVFEISSHYSHEAIERMKMELDSLKDDLYAIQHPGQTYIKTLRATDVTIDPLSNENERSFIDSQHNIVTLPHASAASSKMYLYDEINNEYILPNTLKYEITPVVDGLTVKENDFLNALVPDSTKLWHREYRYLTGLKNHVDTTIVVNLPDNIISNRDVNTIYLHPFPLDTMDIVSLEYRLDKSWQKIPGFKPMENIGNIKFCFSPLEISSIRITLRQRHFIRQGDHQVFHMGIRELGITHSDYYTGACRFEMPVEFNPAFTNKKVLDITPTYQNEETLSVHQKNSKLLSFKVYEVDKEGKQIYIGDTLPIQVKTNKILLKGVLSYDKNTRCTPALSSVQVSYQGDS